VLELTARAAFDGSLELRSKQGPSYSLSEAVARHLLITAITA